MTQAHHYQGNCKHREGNWLWTRMDPEEMEHHWVWIDLQNLGEFWRRNTTQVMTCNRPRRWIFATVAGSQQRISKDVDREACRVPSLGTIAGAHCLTPKHQIPTIPCHMNFTIVCCTFHSIPCWTKYRAAYRISSYNPPQQQNGNATLVVAKLGNHLGC